MKSKLVFAAVAVLALSPPVLYAGNGYGQAALNGLISGTIQAAMNQRQPQTVVVEKRVVVHDRTVVHDQKPAATKKTVKTAPIVAPMVPVAPVQPAPQQTQVVTAPVMPVTPVPVIVVQATPVPTPNDRPTKSDASD
jgi:hypothetical protein